jgi:hypothetical protein
MQQKHPLGKVGVFAGNGNLCTPKGISLLVPRQARDCAFKTLGFESVRQLADSFQHGETLTLFPDPLSCSIPHV